jgi:N-acyl homoserine lactone hydrolase
VMSYLIQIADKSVLFDTGISTNANLGVFVKFLTIENAEESKLLLQLKTAGRTPESVDMVVNSHLHFDHCANNAVFKNKPILVQKKEYETYIYNKRNPMYPKMSGFENMNFQIIDGDTSWTLHDTQFHLIQAAGHSAGQQIMAIENDYFYVLLLADSCYINAEEIYPIEVPGIAGYKESVSTVNRIKEIIREKSAEKTVCLLCSHEITEQSIDCDISAISDDVLYYRFQPLKDNVHLKSRVNRL